MTVLRSIIWIYLHIFTKGLFHLTVATNFNAYSNLLFNNTTSTAEWYTMSSIEYAQDSTLSIDLRRIIRLVYTVFFFYLAVKQLLGRSNDSIEITCLLPIPYITPSDHKSHTDKCFASSFPYHVECRSERQLFECLMKSPEYWCESYIQEINANHQHKQTKPTSYNSV